MLSAPDFSKKQLIFVFSNQGDKISFSNDNIIVKDAENRIKHQSTCYKLFLVMVIGNTNITSGLVQRAKKFGFNICLMTPTMRVYHVISSSAEGNTLLRKKQYSYHKDDIAQWLIINKITNQKEALEQIRKKSPAIKEAICNLNNSIKYLRNERLELPELLGVEGSASRVYFPQMFSNTTWQGRKPRIKSDYINATLDMGYTILFNIIDAILGVYGFDTYYGVMHSCFYMRKSLVCDIMEPVRPLIDFQIRKAINLEQCKEKDYEVYNHKYLLPWKQSPRYIEFLVEPLISHKDEIFQYVQQYYRAFMKEKSIEEFTMFHFKKGDE